MNRVLASAELHRIVEFLNENDHLLVVDDYDEWVDKVQLAIREFPELVFDVLLSEQSESALMVTSEAVINCWGPDSSENLSLIRCLKYSVFERHQKFGINLERFVKVAAWVRAIVEKLESNVSFRGL